MDKIGVLGGTFNPPHLGHLKIAKTALKKFNFEKFLLIVSAKPPLKSQNLASIKDRLAMAKILAKEDSRFEVSEIEIKRAKNGQKSYTIETIKQLKKNYPKKEIYWIIGQDSFLEILQGKWKGGIRILDKANFIVVSRPAFKLAKRLEKKAKKYLKKIKRIKLDIPVSATEIRRKIRAGQDIKKMVPKNILNYIKKRKLYVGQSK